MNEILSIDLDFILEPCINLFGNEVSHPGMVSFNYFKDEMKIFKKEEIEYKIFIKGGIK